MELFQQFLDPLRVLRVLLPVDLDVEDLVLRPASPVVVTGELGDVVMISASRILDLWRTDL
ncbi:hypothetical protein [Haloferax sp. Q22]|uniref:hypothetical protein n=1 Tax=Haloferax sp. (strain Q22) TaxID=1526048 RepID=UPI000737C96B|nr:hypothetical protein [Haloferax sp. Q22]